MKIKLYHAVKGVGKANRELDVAAEVGNRLVCQGLAQVLAHDPPPADKPAAGVMTKAEFQAAGGKFGDERDEAPAPAEEADSDEPEDE